MSHDESKSIVQLQNHKTSLSRVREVQKSEVCEGLRDALAQFDDSFTIVFATLSFYLSCDKEIRADQVFYIDEHSLHLRQYADIWE